jgi:Kdo2-lipid IVA lauroyltransferase/acyltransferase
MAKKNLFFKKIRWRLEWLVYQLLLALAPLLPQSWLEPISQGLAALGYRLAFWEMRKGRQNLDLVYGDSKTKAEKEKILRESCQNIALSVLYFFWSRNLDRKMLEKLIDVPVQTKECIRWVNEKGKGGIPILAHYGNWEMIGVMGAYLGAPKLHIIVHPLKNPLIDGIVTRYRKKSGNQLIDRRGAMIRSVRVLKQEECVVIMYDQNADPAEGGTFAPFLGVEASTTKAAAALSLRTGAPIIPVFCHPRPRGRYELVWEPPVEFKPGGDREEDIQRLTELCNERLEERIFDNPGPWLWMYKRWRIRPTREQGRYPDYSKPEKALRR